MFLRAKLFAEAERRILLWCQAEDKPFKGIDPHTTKEAMGRRRVTWLQYSDDKTGGIMGMMPLVIGMPMRCTDAVDRKRKLFKHNR